MKFSNFIILTLHTPIDICFKSPILPFPPICEHFGNTNACLVFTGGLVTTLGVSGHPTNLYFTVYCTLSCTLYCAINCVQTFKWLGERTFPLPAPVNCPYHYYLSSTECNNVHFTLHYSVQCKLNCTLYIILSSRQNFSFWLILHKQ